VPVLLIHTREDLMIAREARRLALEPDHESGKPKSECGREEAQRASP